MVDFVVLICIGVVIAVILAVVVTLLLAREEYKKQQKKPPELGALFLPVSSEADPPEPRVWLVACQFGATCPRRQVGQAKRAQFCSSCGKQI